MYSSPCWVRSATTLPSSFTKVPTGTSKWRDASITLKLKACRSSTNQFQICWKLLLYILKVRNPKRELYFMKLTFWTQTALPGIYPSIHMRFAHNKVLQLENQPCTKLPHSRQHPLTYFNIHVCTISSITVFASSSLSVKTLIEGEHWWKWFHLLVSCKAKYTHFEHIALVKEAQKSNNLTALSLFEYCMSAHPIYCLNNNISGKSNINLFNCLYLTA